MLDLLTPEQWAMAATIVFVGALVQGTAGVGYAIVSAPLLRIVAPELVPVSVMIGVWLVALASLIRERRDISVSGIGWVLAGRVPGAWIGALLLGAIPARALDISIGGMVLVAVVVMALGSAIPFNATTQFLAGLVSGTTGTATAIGGPPLAMLYRERRGPELRSTLAVVFLAGLSINLATLAARGQISADQLVMGLLLIPPSLLGFLGSSSLRKYVDGEPLRWAILIISSFAAVSLLVRAFL
jgi:uncharacterized membrane protein YfcA